MTAFRWPESPVRFAHPLPVRTGHKEARPATMSPGSRNPSPGPSSHRAWGGSPEFAAWTNRPRTDPPRRADVGHRLLGERRRTFEIFATRFAISNYRIDVHVSRPPADLSFRARSMPRTRND